jgi:hypothetical protein
MKRLTLALLAPLFLAASPAAAEPAAGSSLKDPSSPYADRSCPLVQYVEHKTALPADCRCGTNRAPSNGIDACKRPYDVMKKGIVLGDGPSFASYYNAHISGLFVDKAKDQVVASVYWDGSSNAKGLVVAYNRKTWARTFISGEYKDASGVKEIGKGPKLTHPFAIEPGKDGKWYVLTYKPQTLEIVRVDPTTGDRTLVWRSGDKAYGQCPSGTPDSKTESATMVQYTPDGLAIDDKGGFILGYSNSARDGVGLVRISGDGSQCEYVTMSGTRKDNLTKGSGTAMRGRVQGVELHEGKLLAFTTLEKALWAIDPTTGDRTIVTKPPLGERHIVWDAKRSVLWTAGFLNSVTLGAMDYAPNAKPMNVFSDGGKVRPWFPLSAEGPLRVNSLNYGPVAIDPDTHHLYLGHDSIGLVEFEPETGNSINRSM